MSAASAVRTHSPNTRRQSGRGRSASNGRLPGQVTHEPHRRDGELRPELPSGIVEQVETGELLDASQPVAHGVNHHSTEVDTNPATAKHLVCGPWFGWAESLFG